MLKSAKNASIQRPSKLASLYSNTGSTFADKHEEVCCSKVCVPKRMPMPNPGLYWPYNTKSTGVDAKKTPSRAVTPNVN